MFYHTWKEREIEVDGVVYLHRQCQNCGRDFAMKKGRDEQWNAVHVGSFQFDPLEDAVNSRWLAEPCPRRRLPEDRNENRIKKDHGSKLVAPKSRSAC